MKKSRDQVVYEVETYVSDQLQGFNYGDCYPDELKELMKQLIRETLKGENDPSIESTIALIDDYIDVIKDGEPYGI